MFNLMAILMIYNYTMAFLTIWNNDGVFNDGFFYNGVFYDGVYYDGVFYDGVFWDTSFYGFIYI